MVFEPVENEVLESVAAEDRGKYDLRTCSAQMFGNDGGPADVVVTTLVQHAHRRSLRMSAYHRGLRVAVDDGIAHDMDAKTVELFERRPQRIEGEALAFHEGKQLFIPDRRRRQIDQLCRGINDIARGENQLAPVLLQSDDLFLRFRRNAGGGVFVALGEEIRLQQRDVLNGCCVPVDEHEIDDFECSEIERPQVLWNMGTVLSLADMHVGGNADYEHVGLALCVQQVTQVAGVDYVEHAMAHDDLFRARARADDPLQLVGGLDLVPVFLGERWQHHQRSGLRYWNQVFVALSIESGSQSGALRQ